jgi:hypothetical protein
MEISVLAIVYRAVAAAVAALTLNPLTSPPDEARSPGSRFLEAEFYSVGTGINEEALEVVLHSACTGARRGAVERVFRGSRGGFEGEQTLCIEYTSEAALWSGYNDIRYALRQNDSDQPLPRLTIGDGCSRLRYAPIDPCASRDPAHQTGECDASLTRGPRP